MKSITVIAAVLLLLLAALAGCAKTPAELAEFGGKWVDVNGAYTLVLRGSRLSIAGGAWKKSCRIRLVDEGGTEYLSSADGEYGLFDFMTPLEVCEDGSLAAYEMILDGASRRFRFVRESALEEELAIKDLSTDAPKEIFSEDVSSFSLVFTNSGGSYGLGEEWEHGLYSWQIIREQDGYSMKFTVSGPSYILLNFEETVSEEYVRGLAQVLEDCGAVERNGYHMENSVSRPGYSLYVTYASGETLSVQAYGDAAEECAFDLPALLACAAKQNLREG